MSELPERQGGDRFGLALLSIILAIPASAATGASPWGLVVAVGLLGSTLLLVLRTAQAHAHVRLAAAILVAAAVAASVISALLGENGGADWAVPLVGGLLAMIAPLAIVGALTRERSITIQTVFGALCLYLLAGLFFAYLYGIVGSLSDAPFFVQGAGQTVDYVYFSFTTLTTTGFGDLTAATDLGRMLAISEALLGQLYLVSVVALLVSNLGRTRVSDR